MDFRLPWITDSTGYAPTSWIASGGATACFAALLLLAHRRYASRSLDTAATMVLALLGPACTYLVLNILPFGKPPDTPRVTAPWPLLFAPTVFILAIGVIVTRRASSIAPPIQRKIAAALTVGLGLGLLLFSAYAGWLVLPRAILAWPALLVLGPVWPNGYHHYGPFASNFGWYLMLVAIVAGWLLFASALQRLWRAA